MPRNGAVKGTVRRKAAKAAPKRRRRNSDVSSSIDLSSDGGYSALDDVSDSDDNDEDEIVAAEEKHIIKDVVKTKHRHTLGRSPRPAGSSPVTAAAVVANSNNALQSEEEDADQEGDGDDDDDDDDDAGGADDDDSSSSSDSEFDLGELDEATLLAIGVNPPHDGDVEDAANNNDDLTSWNGISESDANNKGGKRQVRFAGVPDSDSDDSSSSDEEAANDSTFFPDIFVEQNLLDPAFRREIENESDSSVSSSFWDYAAAFEPNNTNNDTIDDDDFFASVLDQPMPPPSTPAAEATDATLDGDGYESDADGNGDDDTTEDEAPPQPAHGRRANARYIDSDDDESTDSDSDSKMSVTPQKRRLPRVRRYFFTPKSRRPVAMINPASGKMVIFTPEKRSARPDRTNDDSDNNLGLENNAAAATDLDAQLNALLNGHDLLDTSNHNSMLQSSPLISSSGAVMMSAMISSQTFGDYIQSHNVGPIEAFFPANMTTENFLGDDSDFSGEILEDEGECNLRIEDFIQFDRNSADGTDPADALFGLSEADLQGQLETDDEFLMGLTNGLQDLEDGDDSAAQTPIANGNSIFFPAGTTSIDDMLFSSLFDSGGSGLGSLGDLGNNNGGNSAPASRRASLAASSSIGDDDLVGGGTGLGSGLAGFMSLTGLSGLEGIEEEDESALEKDDTTTAAGEDESDGDALPPLLAHFGKNSDAVSAFRRNQIDKQLIYSNKATAESLAFSGPLNMGTLRGIRNGSLEAVTTPITPPRRPKQRMMMMAHAAAAARSPLEIIAQKRKASGSVASGGSDNGSGSTLSHKRHRSISEVKDLAL
ncbi:hypothetical protein F503_02819 [Ophiostoma piceae UAMH 11346]|uniref:Uncharacterized protein n=1 Tax=Ophiostoma piceae (strain UAMH 11346) TaxID=1262450 RepID=S3CYJ1_OPHP1|nr:hypothetical protein F503_02819 [Ophiostoma piceae UAMH 11346]